MRRRAAGLAAGFAEKDNPHDMLMVHCPIPPQDEWDEVPSSLCPASPHTGEGRRICLFARSPAG